MDFKTKEGMEEIIRNTAKIGRLISDDDGPFKMILTEEVNTPWYMHRDSSRNECAYWGIVADFPGLGKGKSFIPFECMNNCWKVVTRPRTLEELFKTVELINYFKVPSKCGIEMRETVHGLYGSYWYNRSLEEGRKCYRIVKEATAGHISPDIPVILKRGCTEYELGCHGDSLNWQPFDGQEEIENYIRERVAMVLVMEQQTKFIRDQVMTRWVKWAYANGDSTYLKYTPSGESIYPAYRTYHEE